MSVPDAARALDLHGETHQGKVRTQNQDHFVACILGDPIRVVATSLPDPPATWAEAGAVVLDPDELVLVAVADGVGGGPGGEEASRGALMMLPDAIREGLRPAADPSDISALLRAAALAVHAQLGRLADSNPAVAGMATTLTAWLGSGTRAWVVQIGDSRCYRLRDGALECLTEDQTMAQDLVNRGLVPSLRYAPAGWDNILTSALGGTGAEPVVSQTDRRAGDVVLVCSDGVMKHIPDATLQGLLAEGESSRSLAHRIIRDAVDDGGIDNITAVLLREGGEPE